MFSDETILENNCFTKLLWNNFYKNILKIDLEINDNTNLYNLTYFETIHTALMYKEYKEYMFDFLQIHRSIK